MELRAIILWFLVAIFVSPPAVLSSSNSLNSTNAVTENNQPFYYYYYTPTPLNYYRRVAGQDPAEESYSNYNTGQNQYASPDYTAGNDLAYQSGLIDIGAPATNTNDKSGSNKFRYSIYPGAEETHNSYAYHPGISNGGGYHHGAGGVGWRPSHGDSSSSLTGFLEKIFDELNLDKLIFSPVANFLGFEGVKGSIGLVKLGFILAFLLVPVITLVLVPLTAFVVILVFSIPIPVWRGTKIVQRQLEESTEAFTARLLAADDCIEKLSCKAASFGKKFSPADSLFSRTMDSIAKSKGNGWRKRLARGFHNGINADCEVFKCDPMRAVKKLFKF